MKEILVTGGAGYIGSNTVKLLIETGAKESPVRVVIIDNLLTGHKELVHPKAVFYEIDLLDYKKLKEIFLKYKFDTVIHFAGVSQVEESEKNPKKYFSNNVLGGLNLLKVMAETGCRKIIFSSSASVYGEPLRIPIDEDHPIKPISTYGKTKAIFEESLRYFDKLYGIKYLSLRYFNAGGSSDDHKFGEIHNPETHLIPTVLKLAKQNKIVHIFGDDYKTPDGTCVRDYIHVVDLAKAHIKAMKYLNSEDPRHESAVINLGSSKGFSVKEIIDLCGKAMGKKIKTKISPRRKGDPETLIASNKKAKHLLKWKPEKTIYDIVESAWKFESKL